MVSDFRKIDLHMHTTVSDGTDTPAEILENVRKAGITAFAVTDHDAVKAGVLIRAMLRSDDPFFLPGAEFSCKDEGGKYHILGYGFDPAGAVIGRVVEHGHRLRMSKVHARLDFLREKYGFTFPQKELDDLFAQDNPGKPHIANLMILHGYAADRKQAIRDYIDKLKLDDLHIRPEEAIEGILAAGGVPVLAHPFYGSGDELILGEEMEARLRRLMDFGLLGVEAFYSGFTDKLRAQMLALAQRYDLFVTAGSDYHGMNKMVKLRDTGLDAAAECPAGLRRFLERFGI